MGLYQTITEIEYPESDGKPMGETDVHRRWMMRIHELLEQRYRGQQVYVGCNLLVYYTEGMPHEYVVPDNFVVKNSSPDPRRVYKVWEEGQAPQVVFEVTSRGTRREDEIHKPQIYAKMGVRELFLYDPTSEYLRPPLQGFLLQAAGAVPIEADADGHIVSRELGVTLHLDGGALVLTDAASGSVQLTRAEVAERQAEAAERQAETERLAREAAETVAASLEEEVRRLREQLEQHQDGQA